jgi:regulator of protease activity HflC (stomatin/prohibitin superfamily)
MSNQMHPNVAIFRNILILFVVVIPLFSGFGTIGAGERGVRLRFSAVTGNVLDEGLYFQIPFVDRVVTMSVQIEKNEASADAASKDLQSVSTTVAVNYHLDPARVDSVYQEFRNQYQSRIIDPSIQEAVKSAIALYTAEELITKRTDVREAIKAKVQEKIEPNGIILDELNIVNFSFSKSFNVAIEKKVTAEQEAFAAQNKLEQVKFEAQQQIEEAKGKAEAIRIEAEALKKSPAVLQLRALEKWDGVLPKVTGESVPFINVQ